jgi:hypothetical protein
MNARFHRRNQQLNQTLLLVRLFFCFTSYLKVTLINGKWGTAVDLKDCIGQDNDLVLCFCLRNNYAATTIDAINNRVTISNFILVLLGLEDLEYNACI